MISGKKHKENEWVLLNKHKTKYTFYKKLLIIWYGMTSVPDFFVSL